MNKEVAGGEEEEQKHVQSGEGEKFQVARV